MRIITGVLFLTIALSVRAAPGVPVLPLLSAPIVGIDTAAQDRILLYDMAGTTRTLRFDGAWVRFWGFSPDGCRVLYTLRDGIVGGALFSAALDGSDRRALARYPGAESWGVWEPAWSPNPEIARIAFTFQRDDGTGGRDALSHHVGVVDAAGGEIAVYSVSGDEHTVRWSPDGRWIVYASYEQRPAAPGQAAGTVREADLWLVSADGTSKYRLTDFETGNVTMPRWSPDGDLVAFVYSASPNVDTVWMIGMDQGSVPTQITYGGAMVLDVTWTPDGSGLVISGRGIGGVAENRLWRVGLTGGADASAVPVIGDAALGYHDYPRYSPDGRWLALRSEYGLAVVGDDGAWRWLERDQLGNAPPAWSPPGFGGEGGCLPG